MPDETRNGIVSAIRQAIGLPNADVRTKCFNGTQRIGVWLRPAVNAQDGQARERGLERLNILGKGETLTFFVNAAQVRRQASEVWDRFPKCLSGDGNTPDPNGPIHLTSFSVNFESPNRVVTRIKGFDERPWPDVDFELTVTDTLSLSNGRIHCDTASDLNVDTSWLNFLTGLFLLSLPPLGILFLVERIIIASVDTPAINAGAGCGAVKPIPREIYIPQGLKVVAFYSRIEVFSGGIFAGGSFDVISRSPEATITGPAQIPVVEETPSVTVSYSIRTLDLRYPLKIAWRGDGTPLTPTAEATKFRFNLSGMHVGDILTRRISVRISDADNLIDTAELTIQIHITPADDELPPICKAKPWLPQCRQPIEKAVNLRRIRQP